MLEGENVAARLKHELIDGCINLVSAPGAANDMEKPIQAYVTAS